MRIFFCLMAVSLAVLTAQGKSTYIPTYMSYSHIVVKGDTMVSGISNLCQMEMMSPDGSYRISVQHEDLTQERVKAIKRARRATGWAAASAVLGSVSAAFSDNALQYYIRSRYAQVSAELASIYAGAAHSVQTLRVEVWLENLTDEELMVSDCERGLTWYVQPGHTLLMKPNNPDVVQLRVSDLSNARVSFPTVVAGSAVDKVELKHEDDDCWVIVAYERLSDGTLNPLGGFEWISKHDFNRRLMNYGQYQEFLRKN